jgi:3-methyladenine DNA glycosylase Tag
MKHDTFLARVIADGLASIEKDARITRHPERLQGARDGFNACTGLDAEALGKLLATAQRAVHESRTAREPIETYWRKNYYAIEIEWVCNTLSAALHNQGLPTIVPPTVRGFINATRILGILGVASGVHERSTNG